MPTYQYRCTECGEQLEAVQSFTDDALTECPACSGQLRKVFSAVGIVFKGSGFYRNDSRAGANSSSNGSSNGDSSKSSDSSSDAKESKPTSDSSSSSSSSSDSSSSSSSSSASKKEPAGSPAK